MKPIAAFWSGVAAASVVASTTVYAGRVAASSPVAVVGSRWQGHGRRPLTG
jgi:hypothetical protein